MSYKDDIQRELKELGEKLDSVEKDFKLGDMVICTESGVVGEVIKIYTPTSCEKQLMVKTFDGRRYHAPISTWKWYGFSSNGLTPSQFVVDVLDIKLDAWQKQIIDLISDYDKCKVADQIMIRNEINAFNRRRGMTSLIITRNMMK